MTLEPGRMLSHYKLVEKIGEGGMGVVWKAVDTSLDREVAIKVLPDTFAADPERLSRFEREAKLLASLNHPGIATIHGLHEADGIRFLAMELVAGVDLARRLGQGPLATDEALELGLQVAGALEAAHENGVIHRDLKPANIQLTPDGKAKILDFGLAKAFEPEPAGGTGSISPTLTTPATRAGVILGTAAYMSPEQAKGKVVDRRADIWAFGCVLYEMLVGDRPFVGDGVSEVLAAVIMAPVDVKKIPDAVPAGIRRLLRRCLEKDPRRRLRDIGEARFIIEETLSGAVEKEAAGIETGAALSAGTGRRRFLTLGAVAILAAAIGAAALWALMPTAARAPLRRFELPAQGPYRSGMQGNLVAISPDGSRVAFFDEDRLWIRALDRLETREVSTASEPMFLFWSPDSKWLAFGAGNKLWKAPAEGGESTVISDQPGTLTGGSGASWGPDGRIALARGDFGLYELSARGGDLKTILEPDPDAKGDYHQPVYLPDGSGILFVFHPSGGRPDTLALLADGKRQDLYRIEGQDIWHPAYSETGHILFRRQPTNPGIWALPFSLSSHEVTGEAFLVAPDGDVPSTSSDGTLVHVTGATTRTTQMVWVDRTGKVLGPVGQAQEQWPFPELSPDATQVAISATENESREIWLHDVERGTKTRLTFGAGFTQRPSWSPQGDRVLFPQGGNPPFALKMKAADGSGGEQDLGEGYDPVFSPDGRYLVYSAQDPDTAWDLFMQDLEQGSEPVQWLEEQGVQMWPQISPEGRYLAYNSDETGGVEVYLKRFPGGEGKWQVSVDGGFWPRWSRSGDRLYYADGETIMEVEVTTTPSLRLGQPREVFTREPLGWPLVFAWPPGFDVSPDGKRFVICQAVDHDGTQSGIVVVENWLAEFGLTE